MQRLGVTDHDLHLLRAAIESDQPATPEEEVARSLLQGVAELIGCDLVTLQLMDHTSRHVHHQSSADAPDHGDDPALMSLFWQGFWDCLPCSYPQRTGDTTPTRFSDFDVAPSEYLEAIGLRHELLVPLSVPDDQDHRLLLFRTEGPDFSERDVLLMTLLQPHVAQLHARQLRRRSGRRDLTPRQLGILRLVAAGCTNRQIARALGLTERTVGKHLENIYVRLGAQSRTAAVAAAGVAATAV